MKLKKDLQIRMNWINNKGYYDGPVANFPLSNGFKADFDLRVVAVENVDDTTTYDMLRVDVDELKVFNQSNEYIFLRRDQEKILLESINQKVTW